MMSQIREPSSMYSLAESTPTSLYPSEAPTPAPLSHYHQPYHHPRSSNVASSHHHHQTNNHHMDHGRNSNSNHRHQHNANVNVNGGDAGLPTFQHPSNSAERGNISTSTSGSNFFMNEPMQQQKRQSQHVPPSPYDNGTRGQRFVHATDQQFTYIDTDRDTYSISQIHKSSVPTAETTTFYSPTPAGATLTMSPSRHSTPQRLQHTQPLEHNSPEYATVHALNRGAGTPVSTPVGTPVRLGRGDEQRASTPTNHHHHHYHQSQSSSSKYDSVSRNSLLGGGSYNQQGHGAAPFFQHKDGLITSPKRVAPPHRRLQTPPLPIAQQPRRSPSVPLFEHSTPAPGRGTQAAPMVPQAQKIATPPPVPPTPPIPEVERPSNALWRSNSNNSQHQESHSQRQSNPNLVPVYNPVLKEQHLSAVDPDLVSSSLNTSVPSHQPYEDHMQSEYELLRSKALVRYRERLTQIFQKHAPHKLDLVDATLVSNVGREEQLIESLTQQYEGTGSSAAEQSNQIYQPQPAPQPQTNEQTTTSHVSAPPPPMLHQQQPQQQQQQAHTTDKTRIFGPPFWGVTASNNEDLRVISMWNDGPAAKAGIQPGDRLIAVNGKRLQDFEAARAVMLNSHIGEPVNVEVLRGADDNSVGGQKIVCELIPQTTLADHKGTPHHFDTSSSYRIPKGALLSRNTSPMRSPERHTNNGAHATHTNVGQAAPQTTSHQHTHNGAHSTHTNVGQPAPQTTSHQHAHNGAHSTHTNVGQPPQTTSHLTPEFTELRQLYTKYAPHKVGQEAHVLKNYPGRERQAVDFIRKKYESGYQSPIRGQSSALPPLQAGGSSFQSGNQSQSNYRT